MSATTMSHRGHTNPIVTVAAPTKGSFIDPLTQRWSVMTKIPLAIDCWLASLQPSSNLFWRGKTEEQRTFIQKLESRSFALWDAAAHLNPKFAKVPLNIAVLANEHSVNAFTSGYGTICITKELVKEVLDQKGLTDSQKLDVMSGIVAHEMGHCLQRHITKSICKRLFLIAIQMLSKRFTPLSQMLNKLIELWYALVFYYFTRRQEREADTTGMLILKAHNHLFSGNSDVNQIELSMTPYLWTHFKAFNKTPPALINLFKSHPTREKRARLTAKVGWILQHNPNILTNPERRTAFFKETRSIYDPNLRSDWGLPENELAKVIKRGTPSHPSTPADHMAIRNIDHIGFISDTQRTIMTT